MFMKELGRLASGHIVYDRTVDPILGCKSREMINLLPDIFSRTKANGEYRVVKEFPYSYQMGVSYCVDTSKTDQRDIYYARILGRSGYSRFVKNRQSEPTNSLAVILHRASDGNYVLVAYYPGYVGQPEPWQYDSIKKALTDDPEVVNKSWSFWKRHAFVESYKDIIPESKTTTCPWKKYGQKKRLS